MTGDSGELLGSQVLRAFGEYLYRRHVLLPYRDSSTKLQTTNTQVGKRTARYTSPRLRVRPRLGFDIELGYNTSVDVDAGIGLAGRGGTYRCDERAQIATCSRRPRYTGTPTCYPRRMHWDVLI